MVSISDQKQKFIFLKSQVSFNPNSSPYYPQETKHANHYTLNLTKSIYHLHFAVDKQSKSSIKYNIQLLPGTIHVKVKKLS